MNRPYKLIQVVSEIDAGAICKTLKFVCNLVNISPNATKWVLLCETFSNLLKGYNLTKTYYGKIDEFMIAAYD